MRRAGATRGGRIGALLSGGGARGGDAGAAAWGLWCRRRPLRDAVAATPPARPLPLLQPLIDAVPSGGTLRLSAGRYQGPAQISRPMVVDGGGVATIEGDGRSTVLVVQADGVTVRGLHLRGSGDSQDRTDAGLELTGSDALALRVAAKAT